VVLSSLYHSCLYGLLDVIAIFIPAVTKSNRRGAEFAETWNYLIANWKRIEYLFLEQLVVSVRSVHRALYDSAVLFS
jgi:hypothetical protein